jgi:hypothetical protein
MCHSLPSKSLNELFKITKKHHGFKGHDVKKLNEQVFPLINK